MNLRLEKDGSWVRLSGPRVKKFQDAIRFGVRPQTHRKFDPDAQQWMVYWKWLPFLAKISRAHYTHVDWSGLPPEWQMFAVGSKPPTPLLDLQEDDPFAVLHILESAPMEVVKAAHRALVLKYHPDREGGNHDATATVNDAYGRICKIRSKDS